MNLSNIYYCISANIRYYLADYLPAHIKEQIEFRKKVAKDCLDNGRCLDCGCKTPQLFYASKKCSKDIPCYPPMMSKKLWEWYKGTCCFNKKLNK